MLRIQEVIIELIRLTAPVAVAIGRHDSALAKQYREALSSVALNCAEGTNQRGARRASHYSIALGSAQESWAALRVAAAWGFIAEPSPELANRFAHVIGTLHKVAHRR